MSNTESLTDLERAALRNLATCGYGDKPGDPVWDWCATGGIVTKSKAGGVVASLQRKGFVVCDGSGEDATITVTPAGLAVMAASK
jgi:hypothetical protein